MPFRFASVPFVNSRRISKVFAVLFFVVASISCYIPGESVSAAATCPSSVSGGTVTTVDGACVLSFTTVGSYSWTPPSGVTAVDVLVVAGGGGGGADAAGGGGGGGVIYEQNRLVSGAISLSVGGGGVGGRNSTATVASNGDNSTFGTLTAVGGGRGGTYRGGNGAAGGSGGGGGFDSGIAGSATASQGFAGGDGIGDWSQTGPAAGGGGGAGGLGTAGNVADGNGGPGRSVNITGSSVTYGGGGGGGRWRVTSNIENGGSGGGGRGAGSCGANPSQPGVANTGGGGGGAPAGCQTFGSAGGSGIVVIKYELPDETSPTRTSVTVPTGGTQITIAFDETLSSTSANLSSFTARADGISLGLSSVSVSGSNVVLGVSSAIWQGAVVTVSYADPTSGDDAAAIQDTAGNDVVSFSNVSVTNSSTVTTTTTTTTTAAPVLEIVVSAPTSSTLPVGQTEIPIVSTPVVVQTTIAKSSPINVGKTATSSTTTTVATTGTVARPAPKISAVAAGEADVKIGDKVEIATVQRIQNQLVVSAGALKATLGGLNSDGSSTALDDDGNVRLKSGDVIRIKLAGFKPGSVVEAWLFSTPALLGTAKVGADGTVTGTFTIPKNASEGSHRIAIVAKTTDGKPATLTIGVMVGEWNSGSRIAVWLIVLPIALAVGGALILPATRRRRRLRSAGY